MSLPLITILSALATFSLLLLFHTLAKLSEKFGSVLKMPPLYKWYYVGQIFIGFALLSHLVQAGAFLSAPRQIPATTSPAFSLLFYQIPLTIAVTIGLVITWKYWEWLFTERKK